jgi:uncharacterized protein (TIGR00159 family)
MPEIDQHRPTSPHGRAKSKDENVQISGNISPLTGTRILDAMTTLTAIANNLRIQDVLDMVIIAVMIYVLLVWFKDRASRFVLMGISVVGAVYVTARFFQLYLTTVVLQGFFAILIFVLVVIFQEDLRRFFERLAIIGRFGRPTYKGPLHEETEVLAATATNLARNRIGALIVLKGKDPLERHISGGTALLESIFDPHSPGHDGAVIIAGNRITHFGCHLPLSTDMKQIGTRGLRHTAALGLAERSDALCIVASEERGTISLARNERIAELSGGAALRNELDYFYRELSPQKKPSSRIALELRKNTREKVIAIVLACILWVVFGYQKETVRREFVVPIEYSEVTDNYVIEEPRLREARVILAGTTQAFQLLNTENLKISFRQTGIREGRQNIVLTSDMIRTPSNIAVVAVIPPEITITASRYLPASIPVEVVTTGKPPRGVVVQEVSVSPAAVQVLVPGTLSPGKLKIRTEPVDFGQLPLQTGFDVSLRYPPNIKFPGHKPPAAKVTVKIGKKAVPRTPKR